MTYQASKQSGQMKKQMKKQAVWWASNRIGMASYYIEGTIYYMGRLLIHAGFFLYIEGKERKYITAYVIQSGGYASASGVRQSELQ